MTKPRGRSFRFTLTTMFVAVTGIAVALAIVRIAGRATIPFAAAVAFGVVGVQLARAVNRVGADNAPWFQRAGRAMLALSALLYFLLLSFFCLIGCLPP